MFKDKSTNSFPTRSGILGQTDSAENNSIWEKVYYVDTQSTSHYINAEAGRANVFINQKSIISA